MSLNKVVSSAADAVADIPGRSQPGGRGIPAWPASVVLIEGPSRAGRAELTIVSNNCGVDGGGLEAAAEGAGSTASSPAMSARTREFARRYLSGD